MNLYFESYGCTANQGDTAIMKGLARERGYRIVDTVADADAVVIATCIVIDKTEQAMLRRLGELHESGKKIVITGCLAGAHTDAAKSVAPGALFLKPQHTTHLLDVLDGVPYEGCAVKSGTPREYSDGKAIIPLCEGCPFACSYCITKKARGRLVSFPRGQLVDDARRALAAGCSELWLTSQDTAAYGMELEEKTTLADIVDDIAGLDAPQPYKVRVGMMNPSTALRIADALIDAYRNEHVFTFFHIPVQSGDDAILKAMNRNYTAGDFLRLIERLRSAFPDMVLSTDVIVGFPGEADTQYANTRALIEDVRPDIVNVKRFSLRAGTRAADMPGRVGSNTMKQRSSDMATITHEIGASVNSAYIGRTVRAIVSEHDDASSMCRLGNYKPLVVKERMPIGTVVNVTVTGARPTYLTGSL